MDEDDDVAVAGRRTARTVAHGAFGGSQGKKEAAACRGEVAAAMEERFGGG